MGGVEWKVESACEEFEDNECGILGGIFLSVLVPAVNCLSLIYALYSKISEPPSFFSCYLYTNFREITASLAEICPERNGIQLSCSPRCCTYFIFQNRKHSHTE